MKVTKNNFLLILVVATITFLGIFAYFFVNSDISFKQEVAKLKTQSSSNEIESIEQDILGTDLTDLDKELSDIEKEIEAAY
jgi:hypothetical protein